MSAKKGLGARRDARQGLGSLERTRDRYSVTRLHNNRVTHSATPGKRLT